MQFLPDKKIQFKRDQKQNSQKIHLDQYYTNDNLAQYCIDKTFEIVGKNNIEEIIEPSAGNGSFSSKLDCIAFDIEPKIKDIIYADYLLLDIPYKKNRLIIGNPPYGSRLNLARKFCEKSFKIADYVSFILPISQLNNTQTIYKFDLIHSEDLGLHLYSDKKIHCCLNIYQRPKNGLNKKHRYKNLEILEILEIREVVINNNPKRNRELGDFQYDFAICAWGSSIGKKCNLGEYAKIFFIKIKDEKNKEYYENLILKANWKLLYPMTNTPNLLQWQVYDYVLKNMI